MLRSTLNTGSAWRKDCKTYASESAQTLLWASKRLEGFKGWLQSSVGSAVVVTMIILTRPNQNFIGRCLIPNFLADTIKRPRGGWHARQALQTFDDVLAKNGRAIYIFLTGHALWQRKALACSTKSLLTYFRRTLLIFHATVPIHFPH